MSKPSFESTLSHAAAHGGLRGIAQRVVKHGVVSDAQAATAQATEIGTANTAPRCRASTTPARLTRVERRNQLATTTAAQPLTPTSTGE